MKVFAHYYKSDQTGNEYRWRTLLQFGASWEIKGTVVMKNPGSASPLEKIEDEDTLHHLHLFCPDYDWYTFKSDNTMQNIEKLFRTYYNSKLESELNGIIQIFNLMNVRNTNIEKALIKNKEQILPFSRTIDKDIKQLKPPVYLGWGNLKDISSFSEDTKKLFSVVYNMMDGKYLHVNYAENLFYHPQYLMGRGKNHPNSRYLFHSFCQNTTTPSY